MDTSFDPPVAQLSSHDLALPYLCFFFFVQLLDALKKKWQSVNQVYQTLTHQVILDTQGKIRRKEGCEKELNILEKDIKRLDKKNVYVVDE